MAAAMKMMQGNNAEVAAAMNTFAAPQPAPAAAPPPADITAKKMRK
jgi:hypothetical protein